MVDNKEEKRCKDCPSAASHIWQGMVFCYFYNMEVAAESLQCEWGKSHAECF